MNLREMLENPEFFAENRLPARSDNEWYLSENAYEQSDSTETSLSLCGDWLFNYLTDLPNESSFAKDKAISSGWKSIPVPSHINMQGYGLPHYNNVEYPWDGICDIRPPKLPEKLPTGQYVRFFSVPQSFKGGSLRIRFEGVEPAFRLFVNGVYIGYSEDSFTPSEFDITKYVHDGENMLAVEVYRYSSSSWLEDQDFWRFWGIFRPVYLVFMPKVHIEDVFVRAFANGKFEIDAACCGADKITAQLFAKSGESVYSGELTLSKNKALLRAEINSPMLWSAESPSLYCLKLSVFKDDALQQICALKTGFRTIKIENGIITLNGTRIVFNGVNRHEFCCESGRTVPVENMLRDAALMRQNNITAVRTSHYPNSSEWYKICDEYGIYMIDEANLETHGTWDGTAQWLSKPFSPLPGSDDRWRAAVIDRAKNMLMRDKNHPSVLLWSCGNESFGGSVIYDESQFLREADGTRPVIYESVIHDMRYPDTTDIISTMYLPPDECPKILEKYPEKPYLQIEYAHAMGNSCGNLSEYAELCEQYPRYHGGFIWDWIDQQLLCGDKLYYGGDFRERPNDGSFSADGLIFANGEPSPKLFAVKAAYAPFAISVSKDKITIKNKTLFTNISEYNIYLQLLSDGQEYFSKALYADIKPGESGVIAYEMPLNNSEITARVSVCLKTETVWAEKGYVLCANEGIIQTAASVKSGFCFIDGAQYYGFYSKQLSAMISKKTGLLASLKQNDNEWVHTSPVITFWRAPVSNEAASTISFNKAQWKAASSTRRLISVSINECGEAYEVESIFELPTSPRIFALMRYSFKDGKIKLCAECSPPADMPAPLCFGLEMATYEENSTLNYYGLGEYETEADRTNGALLGIYSFNAHEALAPYMKPQSCGMRFETRYFTLGGIKFSGSMPFAFSALSYTQNELENASHTWQLPPKDKVAVRILSESCGVGGNDSWGALPLEKYLLKTKPYRLEIEITSES